MQYLPMALVGEDPDQPRRTFDEVSLLELGEGIKTNGQLQPVGVVPVRAAATRSSSVPGAFAQVAENQQREGLSNTDLSAAVARMTEAGMKNKEIAWAAGLKEYELKY